jgi:hypothetical protein
MLYFCTIISIIKVRLLLVAALLAVALCFYFDKSVNRSTFGSLSLQARIFPMQLKINSFFITLAKNVFKYILFILPFVLIFKAFYLC